MFLSSAEPGEQFHPIDDLPLFLGLLPLKLLDLLKVKEASFKDELLPSNPLIQACIVQLYHIIFEFDVLLSIVIEVFKVGK